MNELKFCPVCSIPLIHRSDKFENGKTRLSCATGHWTHWDNPIPVLAAIVEIDNKIILVRSAARPNGRLTLITGFMERDETPEQGIAREVKEEVNLDTQYTKLVGVYEFMSKNELIIAYHAKVTGKIVLSSELLEYQLFEPNLLRPWSTGTGFALAEWMYSQGLSVKRNP